MKRESPVKNIMSKDPVTISRVAKFSEVKMIFKDNNIHHVPVVDGRKVVGMVSATDVLGADFSDQFSSGSYEENQVMDQAIDMDSIMTPSVYFVEEETSIKDITKFFTEVSFHALPVVNKKQELIGMVTTTDLIKYLSAQYG